MIRHAGSTVPVYTVRRSLFIIVRLLAAIAVGLAPARAVFRGGTSASLYAGLPITCEVERCIELAGNSDQRWYLYSGLQLLRGQWLSEGETWIHALWPPGQALLNAAVLSVIGTNAPIPIALGVLAAIGWGLIIAIPVLLARNWWQLVITAGAAILLVISPFMLNWPLGPGVMFADGFGAMLLVGGMLILAFRVRPGMFPGSLAPVAAGLLLAGAAYFRSPLEQLVNFLTLMAFLAVGIVLIRAAIRHRHHIDATWWRVGRSWFVRLFIAMLVAQVVMLPWRLETRYELTGEWGFSVADRTLWSSNWVPNSYYPDSQAFLLSWAANGLCLSYPAECQRIQVLEEASGSPYTGAGHYSEVDFRNLAIRSIAADPAPWISSRLTLVIRNWGLTSESPPRDRLVAFGGLALTLVAFLMALERWRRKRDPLMFVLLSTALALTVAVPMVAHFEPRYFLTAQVMMVFFAYGVVLRGQRVDTKFRDRR